MSDLTPDTAFREVDPIPIDIKCRGCNTTLMGLIRYPGADKLTIELVECVMCTPEGRAALLAVIESRQ